MSRRPEPRDFRRWLPVAGLGLCAPGFGVATYLTYEHYTSSASLSCPASGGLVNCLTVTTSRYAEMGGIPVAVLGLAFFAVMAVLQTPGAWSSANPTLRIGRLVWSLAGVATAVWLIYTELFRLDAICMWCTFVHALALMLFVLIVFGTAATAEGLREQAGR